MTVTDDQRDEERASARTLVSLQGIADLARVRRPVVTMWRRRFRTGMDAFPSPVTTAGSRMMFDSAQVAQWLGDTGHGNNAEALADAATAASPADCSFADPGHVAELEALIVLQAQSGPLTGRTTAELLDAAARLDPEDLAMRSEVERHTAAGRDWVAFADRIVDAAYSPAGAMEVVARRASAVATSPGSTAPLGDEAKSLFTQLAAAWPARRVTIGTGISPDLGLQVASTLTEDTPLALSAGDAARGLRRRLQTVGIWVADAADLKDGVYVDRVPHGADDTDVDMLNSIDNLALQLSGDVIAVVLGPARILTDALPRQEGEVRADVLRTDRVRAVVRLPAGLVPGATREPLALWVFGPPALHVPVEDRYTAVADLTDTPLTPTHIADLISDLLAAMGPPEHLHARARRFLTLQRTSSMRARTGALITRTAPRQPSTNTVELATRIHDAARDLGNDQPIVTITDSSPPIPATLALLTDLIRERHARVLPGTRIPTDELGRSGLRVMLSEHLDDPSRIGQPRIDPLAFAEQHPAAQLTHPGDVIFRTGPTTAAWVDHEGSSIVAYPARILRIRATDPGGLIAELVAQDIATQPAGPGAWKRWHLRRIPPAAMASLQATLKEIAATRTALTERLTRLDTYTDALVAGTAAGAVTLTMSRPDATTVTAAES